MFNLIYNIISLFCKADVICHMTSRTYSALKYGYIGGKGMLKWINDKPEIIWSPNIPPNYLEELIKLDTLNDFHTRVIVKSSCSKT